MQTSAIIDIGIGLVFVFAVTAALSTVITELISRFLGLRGQFLLRGLRELVDGDSDRATDLKDAKDLYDRFIKLHDGSKADRKDEAETLTATGVLLGGPLLRNTGMVGQIEERSLSIGQAKPRLGNAYRPSTVTTTDQARDWLHRTRRSLPAYVSSQSFAQAVIDLLVPDATGKTTMAVIRAGVDQLPNSLGTLKRSLQTLVKSAGDDVDEFRLSVERWYDDHMERVSGWYKRHVAKITIVIGALLVVFLNLNAIDISRTLYSDADVRAAVSAMAIESTDCPTDTTDDDANEKCLADLQARLAKAATAGLPIGWATVAECRDAGSDCNWLEAHGILDEDQGLTWRPVLLLLGFLITITALVPGARFWFDLLGKLGSLSSSGPKPTSTTP
ncbi:MAG: hypothetical protein IPO93_10580 [Actinobacteria bacterium]|nr:hypothetical protein [Actinomycetota bacterium]